MKKIEKKIKEKSESKNDPFLIARWISAFLTGEPTEEEKDVYKRQGYGDLALIACIVTGRGRLIMIL